jgi:6-phosphofructokinase 1
MRDPITGRPRVRMVDIHSDRYRIARAYMLRLRREDFDDPEQLGRLAAAARLSPDAFRAEFFHVVENELPTMSLTRPPSGT